MENFIFCAVDITFRKKQKKVVVTGQVTGQWKHTTACCNGLQGVFDILSGSFVVAILSGPNLKIIIIPKVWSLS